jgi:ABC-type branched-subunit amino acid transport system ATPase component
MLSVHDLRRDFGGVHAVDGASFEVRAGTITGLIGPNGAGKSTVIGVIAGAIRPTAGTITFLGHDLTARPPHQVARRGLVRTFQLSSEFGRLTVLENVLVAAPQQPGESFWGAMLGRRHWQRRELELVERARELMARFGLADKEDEYAGNLSGGQKRLLEIVRGLMADPKLLLLDEPMAGVNPTLGASIQEHLAHLRDEGLTMLMVEHELAVVERLCDPVVVMAQGRVIAEGAMSEVRTRREVLDAYLAG